MVTMLADNMGTCDVRLSPPETDFAALLYYDVEQ